MDYQSDCNRIVKNSDQKYEEVTIFTPRHEYANLGAVGQRNIDFLLYIS